MPWLLRHATPAVVLLGLVLLAIAGTSFVVNQQRLTEEIETTFVSRSELLGKFVALRRNQVSVMRDLLLERYAEQPASGAPALKVILHPGRNFWEVEPAEQTVAGDVTGSGAPVLTAEAGREVAAAFAMDPQIKATLELNKEVLWIYYLSANGFIYIAPKVAPDTFHFTPALYERGYWRRATPQPNPERRMRMIAQGLNEDMAGKGLILTFSEPVYAQDRFLGVVAMDLGVETLQQLTNVGNTVGETMMVDGQQGLVSRRGGVEAGTELHAPLTPKPLDWSRDEHGDLWLSTPIIMNELWLLHRVHPWELYWATAQRSATTWAMIVLLALIGSISWRLRRALESVTRVMRIDPLTEVLNRRGFYEKAEGILAIAKRKALTRAVLIMDIDHFKKVNDIHGHAVGDTVLKQVGKYLHEALRASDLVCRWGGEEFLVVLVLDRAEQAAPAAERMRQEAQRSRTGPDGGAVSLSGGLVVMRENEPIDEAIKRADLLLYDAKRQGRNQIIADVT